jgi:hypothetical protein
MNYYKGWSPQQRLASLEKTKKAIRDGIIPNPTQCNRCGQTEGIIQYHNNDYSHHIDYLEQLCWTCHMMLHNEKRNPISHRIYFEFVELGYQGEPVYKHNWSKLDKYLVFDKKVK